MTKLERVAAALRELAACDVTVPAIYVYPNLYDEMRADPIIHHFVLQDPDGSGLLYPFRSIDGVPIGIIRKQGGVFMLKELKPI